MQDLMNFDISFNIENYSVFSMNVDVVGKKQIMFKF